MTPEIGELAGFAPRPEAHASAARVTTLHVTGAALAANPGRRICGCIRQTSPGPIVVHGSRIGRLGIRVFAEPGRRAAATVTGLLAALLWNAAACMSLG
ncbi:hypothetical protein [Bradyrhizobium japonicum]|uniref:hypothetical protein n=1 Tax=Bradyrhizobium japonicum TaxID=375 RepID=UPI001B8A2733|nr:hypothetical protein [Bradyrhizobium japonicum]MBR0974408.1 hypothetical protein [Bradyrhizobium japonicum]